eukprot:g5921.t1
MARCIRARPGGKPRHHSIVAAACRKQPGRNHFVATLNVAKGPNVRRMRVCSVGLGSCREFSMSETNQKGENSIAADAWTNKVDRRLSIGQVLHWAEDLSTRKVQDAVYRFIQQAPGNLAYNAQYKLVKLGCQQHPMIGQRILKLLLERFPEIIKTPHAANMLLDVVTAWRFFETRLDSTYGRKMSNKCCLQFAELGVEKDTRICSIMISNYLDTEATVHQAFEVLEEMQNDGIPYDERTFRQFMRKLCWYNRDIEAAYRIIYEMEIRGVQRTLMTYETLFSLLADLGSPDSVDEAWERMTEEGVSPKMETYALIIRCISKTSRPGTACKDGMKYFELLLKDKAVTEDFDSKVLEALLFCASRDKNYDKSLEFCNWWENLGHGQMLTPTAWGAFLLCASQQSNLNKLNDALEKFERIQTTDDSEKQLHHRTYHYYMDLVYKIDQVRHEMGIGDEPNLKKYQDLYATLFKSGKLSESGYRNHYCFLNKHTSFTFQLGLDFFLKNFKFSTDSKVALKPKLSKHLKFLNLSIRYDEYKAYMDPEMEERIIKWLDDNYLGYNEYEYNLPTDGFLRKAGTKISVLWQDILMYQMKHQGFPTGICMGLERKPKKVGRLTNILKNIVQENREKNN